MEKIAKYYLSAEGVVLCLILLSGFYDPALLLYGILFFGIIASFVGSIISLLWCRSRLHAQGLIKWPFALMVANAAFFLCMIVFILLIFSNSANFMM